MEASSSCGDMVPPRAEYPRPQFVRKRWLSLNGRWEFERDPGDVGGRAGWHRRSSFSERIVVPFAAESQLSGIGDAGFHDVVWYRRSVVVPADWAGDHVLLHFGAVDYSADVWVNDTHVGHHQGGQTPFSFNVGRCREDPAAPTRLTIVVRAEDRARDRTQPRGKQYWEEHADGIYYTRTTGIWQSVWLEPVASAHIQSVRGTPCLDDGSVQWRLALGGRVPEEPGLRLNITVSDAEGPYGTVDVPVGAREFECGLPAHRGGWPPRAWSPDDPHLYDVHFRLWRGDELVDEVDSYLGFRRFEARDGRLWLNGRPYFLKMVLDQGYFPGGVLTAATGDALRRDVEMVKAMGFNGVRKHQKVEDPVWLSWCDRLGVLVFGEMANSFAFSPASVRRITREWMAVIERDYNHPAIVAWVPINESWGIPDVSRDSRQRAHLDALYHLTKSLDSTRLVVSNDGWEHGQGDLCTLHDYAGEATALAQRYGTLSEVLKAQPAGRALYAPGHHYAGEPVLVTEMGGVALDVADGRGWGYSSAESGTALAARYRELVTALAACPPVQGFCYTQLTDVEQEVNGLLTFERTPKMDVNAIREVNEALDQGRAVAGA
jgi:beta-galactosidase/beta-glucuronidase